LVFEANELNAFQISNDSPVKLTQIMLLKSTLFSSCYSLKISLMTEDLAVPQEHISITGDS
jgi:hypothetical protein